MAFLMQLDVKGLHFMSPSIEPRHDRMVVMEMPPYSSVLIMLCNVRIMPTPCLV